MPDHTAVHHWVEYINQQYGVDVIPSPMVAKTLIQRAKYLRSTFRKLSGGQPQRSFLEKEWTFKEPFYARIHSH